MNAHLLGDVDKSARDQSGICWRHGLSGRFCGLGERTVNPNDCAQGRCKHKSDNPYFLVSLAFMNLSAHPFCSSRGFTRAGISAVGGTQWFAIASSVVAPVKQTRPNPRRNPALRGAPFHSPIITPESAAVMIMKI